MASDAKKCLFLCHKDLFQLLPVGVTQHWYELITYKTVLMRNYEELVKLLYIEAIESLYINISLGEKKFWQGFHSGMR